MNTALDMAVVGAGPVGLALALHAARTLPHARITLFDARPLERDVAGDPRTLALSLGSVQMLQRLGAWPAAAAEPIVEVHVSQQAPALTLPWAGVAQPEVLLTAAALAVPQLGAVLGYGVLVSALQAAWLAAAAAQPQRLRSRFGTAVAGLKALPSGVEVDAGIAEAFDLAVVAEGGLFGAQARKPLTRDYAQTAWVGSVELEGWRSRNGAAGADSGAPTRGRAFERFTRQGPAALLPLPAAPGGRLRAALVWCVDGRNDPVRELNDAQRLAVLNTLFPRSAGRLVALSPLKALALGLNAERTLVQGRTVCIGNAAQTLHPVAGQGLNLGLRDAHTLVAALRRDGGGGDVDAALKRAEWQRAPDRWSVIATTDFLARSFTWQLPGAASLRGLGLAALQAAPPLQRWLARQMMFGVR
jgi:2-octaprenyl-6-methoxyphenol hydroxylase